MNLKLEGRGYFLLSSLSSKSPTHTKVSCHKRDISVSIRHCKYMMIQISKAMFRLVFIGSIVIFFSNAEDDYYTSNMVKMCLFYPSPSGHARSDPIINQQCASDHVHTVRILTSGGTFLNHMVPFLTYFILSTKVLRASELSSRYYLRGYTRHRSCFQLNSIH